MDSFLNPHIRIPKAKQMGLESADPVELRDVGIRCIMIPVFGIFIPLLTGLFDPVPASLGYLAFGYLLFLSLAFLIWHGNRWFLIQQRQYYDWFNQPVRKLVMLVFANVFFTAPITVLVLWAWYNAVQFDVDWNAIRVVTLINVICVIFVTHAYETVYLIQQREADMLRLERIERAKAEAELEALKGQLDPHFMFNSLNTLAQLVDEDRQNARTFIERLADVYRYILMSRQRELVPLDEEMAFVDAFLTLLRLRFSDALVFRVQGPLDNRYLPPIALQILIENAIKHNEFSANHPLELCCAIDSDSLTLSHRKRRKRRAPRGTGTGLRNLRERYRMLGDREVVVDNQPNLFSVELPLIRMKT